MTGANFGDEGKGLAVDHFCGTGESSLVVRHNGGAQAGHTVENEGRRFVFHQLSSGSFRRGATFLAHTFKPDLFKLRSEYSDFYSLSGIRPAVYGDNRARITIPDDVILNMALETSRGSDRHGSCGMGIYESVLRDEAGFPLTVGRLAGMSARELYLLLSHIRREYSRPRAELLGSDNLLKNSADEILRGLELIKPGESLKALTGKYEITVFEGAQGLLLDSENESFAPHVTASRTGLHNPLKLCEECGIALGLAVYVMRSYVTRHGAGPLPCECDRTVLGDIGPDPTNVENRWQGRIRYAFYPSVGELAGAVLGDLSGKEAEAALLVTHLNETNGMVRFLHGDVPACELTAREEFSGRVKRIFRSYSPCSVIE